MYIQNKLEENIMVYYLLYFFWKSINFSKLYQNSPIDTSISRLEVLICWKLHCQVSWNTPKDIEDRNVKVM